jgi:methionyl-tRNA formyltransferase
MRIAFAGTPEFAAQALRALIAAGYPIPLVLTQPDRPAGRGMRLKASPVKELALAHGLSVHQPESLKTGEAHTPILDAEPEIMVVAAYGLILPQAVLEIPSLGCVNIHASLLPRWRGAAPIQRAILAGDVQTGITIMQMDAGLDTGAILALASLPIAEDDTAGSLHDRLAALGAREIVAVLPKLAAGGVASVRQDGNGATYAPKIAKEEARIDWQHSAAEIDRLVRAFDPHPGAYTEHHGEFVKVWHTRVVSGEGQPGTVLTTAPRWTVACGVGALEILEVQRAGGRRMAAEAYLKGSSLRPGNRLG